MRPAADPYDQGAARFSADFSFSLYQQEHGETMKKIPSAIATSLIVLSLGAGTVALLLWGVRMVQTGIQRGFGAVRRVSRPQRCQRKRSPHS